MIIREDYLKKIRPLIDKNIVKVLTGIRRSGKSTILLQIIDELKKNGIKNENIILINFESEEFQDMSEKNELNKYVKEHIKNNEKYYLFFDEIQNINGWEKSIAGFMVDYNADIYITGSNSKLLSGELATHLTGRFIQFHIYPFSFKESIQFNEKLGIKTSIEKQFEDYINRGGMPFTYQLDKEFYTNYLTDLYKTILFEDVLRRTNVRNVDLLEKILRYIIMNIAHPFSAESIRKYLKNKAKRTTKKETIYNYLKYFENACFIHRVYREDIMGKEILKTNEKFYLTDHGFREAIYGNNKRDINLVLENIVYMEMLRRGYSVTVGKIDDKEIDFIGKKKDRKIYIQVSYQVITEKTKEREFNPLLIINDNYPKYVVTQDDLEYNYEGIEKIDIRNFLLKDW